MATNDIAVLRQSSIFAEPSYLPGGFRLMRAETKDATSEIGMVLTYEGPHGMQRGSIELLRARMATDVIDIIAPTPSANVELQRITIRGAPALILVPKPGTEMEQIGFVTVWMVRAGVKTVISAHGISAQDARLMAESIP